MWKDSLKKSPKGIDNKKTEISEQLKNVVELVSTENIEDAKIRLHEIMKDIDELKLLMEEYRGGRGVRKPTYDEMQEGVSLHELNLRPKYDEEMRE